MTVETLSEMYKKKIDQADREKCEYLLKMRYAFPRFNLSHACDDWFDVEHESVHCIHFCPRAIFLGLKDYPGYKPLFVALYCCHTFILFHINILHKP